LLGGKKVHPRRQNPGYAYVHLQVCILTAAPITTPFGATTYYLEKTTFETLKNKHYFSQGGAVALCRRGGQINKFCVAYFLSNIVEIGQYMYTLQ